MRVQVISVFDREFNIPHMWTVAALEGPGPVPKMSRSLKKGPGPIDIECTKQV